MLPREKTYHPEMETPIPDIKEPEGRSVKRTREDAQLDDDENVHTSNQPTDTNLYKLIDEINKYEPNFSLESYLAKKKRKIESLEYTLYNLLKPHQWRMRVTIETLKTNGVNPLVISQTYMDILINVDINVCMKWKGLSSLSLDNQSKSTIYPLRIYRADKDKTHIKLDLDDLSIPNRIVHLCRKGLGDQFTKDISKGYFSFKCSDTPEHYEFHYKF